MDELIENLIAIEKLGIVNIYRDSATLREAIKELTRFRWVPITEDVPDTDRYVLLSFENYTLPTIGRYERDEEGGGAFYDNDDDRTLASYGLVVNAWMELPKCYEE